MASTYITRTPSSAGNRKTFTISVWVKRTTLDSDYILVAKTGTGASDSFYFGFRANQIQITSQSAGGTSNISVRSNAVYRDTFGWYNLVLAVDTTQSTASDRVKLYVNGSQVTSLELNTYPNQNDDIYGINNTIEHAFGRENYEGGVDYHEYLLSHIHFIDGTAYTPSAFGETDANGVWTIKTSPSVTYGTNGFFILKDGNSVTDQSGNSNNFTLGGGTLTKTEDCPDNVFATGNPLHRGTNLGDATFSNGNLTHNGTTSGGSYPYTFSTLAASSGKWYAEFKKITGDTMIGIGSGISDSFLGGTGSAYGYAMYPTGEVFTSGSGNAYGNALSNNDIIGVAMDLDNSKCYWSKNGVWQNSGDPTSGATGTGAFSIQSTTSNTTGFYHFAYGKAGNDVTDIEANFGNGYFGTTAVSSAGTNASGIGIFEYDVPTGYTALSTKGLNL